MGQDRCTREWYYNVRSIRMRWSTRKLHTHTRRSRKIGNQSTPRLPPCQGGKETVVRWEWGWGLLKSSSSTAYQRCVPISSRIRLTGQKTWVAAQALIGLQSRVHKREQCLSVVRIMQLSAMVEKERYPRSRVSHGGSLSTLEDVRRRSDTRTRSSFVLC